MLYNVCTVLISILSLFCTGVIARKTAYYGQGAGSIRLDNVECSGTEQNLIDCPHITNHNCAHSKDAGVDCPGIIICRLLISVCLAS